MLKKKFTIITGLIVFIIKSTNFLYSHDNEINIPSQFSFCTTSTWKDFTLKNFSSQVKPKRLAWTEMITLKSTKPINLQEIQLKWCGEKITRLQASLYQKKDTKNLIIPIQENLVCDGLWNPKEQILTFYVDKKIVAVNKYYLFLNFLENDTKKIRQGKFIIPEEQSLKLVQLQ